MKYNEVTPTFWNALISTEDERFYSHHGVDFMGIGGAVKDALTRDGARGASTITQQLAKNMFHIRNKEYSGVLGKIPGLRMLIAKAKEWIIAYKIEFIYSKNEILTMYANTVDFGNNAYGIKTAARTYFNTTPQHLTTEQSATLVGMLKATTYIKYSKLPMKLDVHVEENYDGRAQYFREYVADYLKDWLKDNDYDLYSSGLKIYTTIDTRMQKYAENAAKKQMHKIQQDFNKHWSGQDPWRDENGDLVPGFIEGIAERQPFYKRLVQKYHNQPASVLYYINKPHKVRLFDYEKGEIEKEMSSMYSIRYMVRFMHCSMIAMEPETGAVRAWVGDIDFKTWKYDKVTAQRQPGSTFKLFVYSEAMNQGLAPCDKRRDEFISMQVPDKKTGIIRTWIPRNANGNYSGDSITLKAGFARSVNTIAVRLGQEMGIKNIIRTAQEMGIKSPLENEPSLALGSSDVNLLELVNAYCTVANDGEHCDPVVVTKIVDQRGNEVYVAPHTNKQVLPYQTAFFMQQLLKGGLTEPGGTSRSLNQYIFKDTDWGGKTGTSNNHSDAWFMAVSPKLVVGAWVGGEYRSIHFRTGALGQGSKTALPMCGNFIYDLMRDKAFQKYHAKWLPNPERDIDPSMYNCQSVVRAKRTPDSLHTHYKNERKQQPDEEVQNEEEENNVEIENVQMPTHNSEESGRPKKSRPSRQPSSPINAPKPRIEPLEI